MFFAFLSGGGVPQAAVVLLVLRVLLFIYSGAVASVA
jgi:hypothetical protein